MPSDDQASGLPPVEEGRPLTLDEFKELIRDHLELLRTVKVEALRDLDEEPLTAIGVRVLIAQWLRENPPEEACPKGVCPGCYHPLDSCSYCDIYAVAHGVAPHDIPPARLIGGVTTVPDSGESHAQRAIETAEKVVLPRLVRSRRLDHDLSAMGEVLTIGAMRAVATEMARWPEFRTDCADDSEKGEGGSKV